MIASRRSIGRVVMPVSRPAERIDFEPGGIATQLSHNKHYGKLSASRSVQAPRNVASSVSSSGLRQFDAQTVVTGLDPGGQFRAQLAVIEALIHMGQNCPA